MTAVIVSFTISTIVGPLMISLLKKRKAGQVVREDGPGTHLKKNGTPTMGGILILLSVTLTSLLFWQKYPKILPVLLVMLGFGLIGFLDDFLKILCKRSMGLSALQKLVLQLAVGLLFALYLEKHCRVALSMRLPFMQGYYVNFGVWTMPVLLFIITGTVNGTNLTDGLDGLLTSVTILIATFFSVMAIGMKTGLEPITLALTGALLGFLLFNIHPAAVFMGDTGSLAIGGFLSAAACMMQLQLYLPIVGFIYMAEVLSVILQVVYFKLTGGKRLFKMAPIHHHFELKGMSEDRIVVLFSVITAILCLLSLYG